jgi:polysaccharide export outer membrane protein
MISTKHITRPGLYKVAVRLPWILSLGALLYGLYPSMAQEKGRTAEDSKVTPPRAAQSLPPLVSPAKLGPNDRLSVWALGVPEMPDKPVRIDENGYLDLPMLGRVKAAGLTAEQLREEIQTKLAPYVREPMVSVSVTETFNQPVSVLGAVNTPGVYQLAGAKTLMDVLALAGGLRSDAGNTIRVTRVKADSDKSEPEFTVTEVRIRALLDAVDPNDNIFIRPRDVISVPRADMVYVIGEVEKAGGFVLNEQESVSVLQALSLAGGLSPIASPQSSKILRSTSAGVARAEIQVDLKRILGGRTPDVPLLPGDILFIPTSAAKTAGRRALETALQLGVGLVIWRR